MTKTMISLLLLLAVVSAGYVYLSSPKGQHRIAPGVRVAAPMAPPRSNPLVDQMVREIDAALPIIRQGLEAGGDMGTCSQLNLNRGKAIGLGLTTHPVVALAAEAQKLGLCKGIL